MIKFLQFGFLTMFYVSLFFIISIFSSTPLITFFILCVALGIPFNMLVEKSIEEILKNK